jgi:hypothetical protein
MEGENATKDYMPVSTHKTLGIVYRIDGSNSMEGDPLKGEN